MMDPICKKCGHHPCPGCVDWCDVMVHNIYCPKCDEVVAEAGDKPEGLWMTCQHCKHEWGLSLVKPNSADDNIGVDPCCDHECEWDQPDDYVARWCEQQKRK